VKIAIGILVVTTTLATLVALASYVMISVLTLG
jgi:hypothetical protein